MRSHATDGYPRILFTNGISSMIQQKTDDKVSIIYALVISLVQVAGKSILLDKAFIEKASYKNISYLFEKMLTH